jgi:hypothetical protein
MVAPAAAAATAPVTTAATAAPATAATAHATTAATAVSAAAVPVHRLCLMHHARVSLWRRSGVREPGQADGRKAKRPGDRGRANNLLQDHAIPL